MTNIFLPAIILIAIFSPLFKFCYFGGLDEFGFADMEKMKQVRYRAKIDVFWTACGAAYILSIAFLFLNKGDANICRNPFFIVLSALALLSVLPPLTMAAICLIVGSIGALCDLVIFLPVEIIRRKIYTPSPRTGE